MLFFNNIESYLERNSNIPFSELPFNEIDSLVLCELIYADLSGIVPENGIVSIPDVRKRFFRKHSRSKLRRQLIYFARAPLMLDAMADGARYSSMKVRDYVKIIDDKADIQMTAVTFLPDDGTAFVCFSGTDKTISGWKEDFNFSYMKETEGQRLAVKYLNDAACMTDRPLRAGGHSKGANFAVYASSFVNRDIQDRIIDIYALDGPGFREEITRTENYRRIVPKVKSIVPEESIIGQLLVHDYKDIVVKSSGIGILQHDGFTWCLEHNKFIRSKLSNNAKFFRDAQTDWLAKMDDKAREAFVTILFAPLEATKMSSLDEIYTKRMEAAISILDSLNDMTPEEHRSMRVFLQELFRSCGVKAIESALTDIRK